MPDSTQGRLSPWRAVRLLLLLLMVGCRPTQAVSHSQERVAEIPQPVRSTPSPADPAFALQSRPTWDPAAFVPTGSPSPVSTQTVFAPAGDGVTPGSTPAAAINFKVCSPLVEHALEALPEIISAPYQPPPPGREERHHGVDFSYYRQGERSSILGEPVQSVLAGTVALSLVDQFPYGNVIVVETPAGQLPVEIAAQVGMAGEESLYILYAHLDGPPLASLGEQVAACQLLGAVGKSGNAGVQHLHLETRLGPQGVQFTSMAYYDPQASEEEKVNYLRWRIGGEFRHFDPMTLLTP